MPYVTDAEPIFMWGFNLQKMNYSSYYINQIKTYVKMPDLLALFGIEINRSGRIKCPFHNGNDENCQVNDNYLYCHVCHSREDQIGFVQFMCSTDFMGAVKKINSDFSLGLPIGEEINQEMQEKIKKKQEEILKKQRERQKIRDDLNEEFFNSLDEEIYCEKMLKKFKPKPGCKSVSVNYLKYLGEYEYAKYRLQCAVEDEYIYEKNERNRRNRCQHS